MNDTLRIVLPRDTCAYLPEESSALEYRVIPDATADDYAELLSRGWRRHGMYFFRPACPNCVKCRSLRVDVRRFRPTKSQRRTLAKNTDVRLEVHRASVTREHIRLFNAYHADMTERKDWPDHQVIADEYYSSFLAGDWDFAYEFRFLREDQLLGVSLVDIVPGAMSSVYFYHDPTWRPSGPGTFTILQEIEYARQAELDSVYLGYWIEQCASMAYKNRFGPHEILEEYIEDELAPDWRSPGPPSGNPLAENQPS